MKIASIEVPSRMPLILNKTLGFHPCGILEARQSTTSNVLFSDVFTDLRNIKKANFPDTFCLENYEADGLGWIHSLNLKLTDKDHNLLYFSLFSSILDIEGGDLIVSFYDRRISLPSFDTKITAEARKKSEQLGWQIFTEEISPHLTCAELKKE